LESTTFFGIHAAELVAKEINGFPKFDLAHARCAFWVVGAPNGSILENSKTTPSPPFLCVARHKGWGEMV
jgi:hypothetical protein